MEISLPSNFQHEKYLYNWTTKRFMPEDEDIGEKWREDPLSGVFFGLVLIIAASIYLFRTQLPGEDWWPWLLVGIGCVFLLEALIRYTRTEYRRPAFGRVVAGAILIALGAGFVYGFTELWPVIFIVIGGLILVYYIRQSA